MAFIQFECLLILEQANCLSHVGLMVLVQAIGLLNALSHLVQANGFPPVFTQCVFSILLGLLMPCHIRCRQMGFLLCFQNTSDFECLVTYSAAKWLSNCVHPVCFVKTPRVLNALSHLVQTNSFPPVFSQCVFSKHLGFECLVTCSAGKWRSSCVHLYSVFFQYLLDY